jgi:hypothetical protein
LGQRYKERRNTMREIQKERTDIKRKGVKDLFVEREKKSKLIRKLGDC